MPDYQRVVLEVDQATKFTYLLKVDLYNPIRLPLSLDQLCELYIKMSVSFYHPKTNKLHDTTLRLLLYLTSTLIPPEHFRNRDTTTARKKTLAIYLF